MATSQGLDIPPGWEELFAKILASFATAAGYTLEKVAGPSSRYRSPIIAARSLFVLFESTWDSLTGTQKNLWTTYWGTLPFGDHSGAGNWPGSGYSAFVYVNAPRWRAGLSLLLEPPATNLIYNGNFALGNDGWDRIHTAVSASRMYFSPVANYAEFFSDAGHQIFPNVDHTYRFTGFVGPGAGHVYCIYYPSNGPSAPMIGYFPGGHGAFSFDFDVGPGFTAKIDCMTEDGFDGYLDSLALYDLGLTP